MYIGDDCDRVDDDDARDVEVERLELDEPPRLLDPLGRLGPAPPVRVRALGVLERNDVQIQFAAPAPDDAALKRPVWVMTLFVMWPPPLHPILAIRSPSTKDEAIRWSAPARTSR